MIAGGKLFYLFPENGREQHYVLIQFFCQNQQGTQRCRFNIIGTNLWGRLHCFTSTHCSHSHVNEGVVQGCSSFRKQDKINALVTLVLRT
mmetsp:Transcript_21674/g.45558  ORF Transcript_21674/g.45558 Transcript_21674/m.45558 type:complete len:90 (-) Transcript_21674:387-656(-)